ncbi:MAG: hypothetical protein MZV63_04930 [Marinilabiliales bacterium]|nr:hypothetical protein [Marinilabiliales bacterium]
MLSFLKRKTKFVNEGYEQVEEVLNNYSMGFITNNERYNQIIDIWTHVNARLTQIADEAAFERQAGLQLGLYDA